MLAVRRRQRGFSLAELMVVLAIAAILMAGALPGMSALVRSQQLKAAAHDLLGAIALARSQAVARGSRVELAPADPAGIDWSRGWVVFADRDGDRRPGAGDDIISVHAALPQGIAIGSTFPNKRGADYIAYNGAGRSCTDTSSLAARWGTLSLFQGEHTRRIKINMLGRARLCDPVRHGAACSGAAEAP